MPPEQREQRLWPPRLMRPIPGSVSISAAGGASCSGLSPKSLVASAHTPCPVCFLIPRNGADYHKIGLALLRNLNFNNTVTRPQRLFTFAKAVCSLSLCPSDFVRRLGSWPRRRALCFTSSKNFFRSSAQSLLALRVDTLFALGYRVGATLVTEKPSTKNFLGSIAVCHTRSAVCGSLEV